MAEWRERRFDQRTILGGWPLIDSHSERLGAYQQPQRIGLRQGTGADAKFARFAGQFNALGRSQPFPIDPDDLATAFGVVSRASLPAEHPPWGHKVGGPGGHSAQQRQGPS